MDQHGTEVSVTAWPVVVISVGEALGEAAIDCIIQGMDRVVERREKFSLIVDTRAMKGFPDAKGRARFGDYMKERTFAEATYNCGNAIIISSSLARGMLTAIQWFRPPVTKHGYFAGFEESLAWCCERLRERNVPYSPSLEQLRQSSAR